MLRAYVLEFGAHWDQFLPLAEFACNNNYNSSIQMALFEALYGRRYRFLVGWIESTKPRPWGTYLIREALDQVRVTQDILRTTQTRHQSYAYQRHRPLRLSVGDRVLLCVSPLKDVMRFGKRGKLRPRYNGPFEILWIYDAVELDDCFTFVEEPIAILVSDVKRLRSTDILVVKVHCRHRLVEEATWETEQEM
ncbi:uncharacterized protein LOC125863898 [Solanum stenotomum]|uniref:uncharacterized protein LOC125863898 n=1 Tax=Solanum stenotomum TaxID=172797 RepID=UPI0020D1B68A|nr:uncharacterized protein LOC125863898 [Solanum stenotomum]